MHIYRKINIYLQLLSFLIIISSYSFYDAHILSKVSLYWNIHYYTKVRNKEYITKRPRSLVHSYAATHYLKMDKAS